MVNLPDSHVVNSCDVAVNVVILHSLMCAMYPLCMCVFAPLLPRLSDSGHVPCGLMMQSSVYSFIGEYTVFQPTRMSGTGLD